MKLIERLNKRMDNGFTLRTFADVAGKSTASISRFINGNHIIELYAALKLVRAYFPEDEAELMNDFCKNMDRKNNRIAIEYAMINGNKELFLFLLNKLKQSSNRLDNEWARAYEFEHIRNEAKQRPIHLLDQIKMTKTEAIELKAYLMILSSYCYTDLKQFDMMRSSLLEVEKFIHQINDPFIKNSYNIRLCQSLSVISLLLNNIDDCRKYGHRVMNHELFQSLSGPVYHAVGQSYLFENYEKALMYMNEARRIYQHLNRPNIVRSIEHSINFLQIYYHKDPEYLNHNDTISDRHSQAFYHIMKKNDAKAASILDQIKVDDLADYHKGFYFFYRGKITNHEEYYYESIYHFQKSGDFFYVQVPSIELHKLGTPSYKLKVLNI